MSPTCPCDGGGPAPAPTPTPNLTCRCTYLVFGACTLRGQGPCMHVNSRIHPLGRPGSRPCRQSRGRTVLCGLFCQFIFRQGKTCNAIRSFKTFHHVCQQAPNLTHGDEREREESKPLRPAWSEIALLSVAAARTGMHMQWLNQLTQPPIYSKMFDSDDAAAKKNGWYWYLNGTCRGAQYSHPSIGSRCRKAILGTPDYSPRARRTGASGSQRR